MDRTPADRTPEDSQAQGADGYLFDDVELPAEPSVHDWIELLTLVGA